MATNNPVYEVIVEDDYPQRTGSSVSPDIASRSRPRSWSSRSEPKKRAASGGVPLDVSRRSEDKCNPNPCFYESLLPKKLVNYICRSRSAGSVPRSRSRSDSRKRFSKQFLIEGGQSFLRKVKKFGSEGTFFGKSGAGSKRAHERDESEVKPAKIFTVAELRAEPAVTPKPIPRKKGPLGRAWIRNNPDIKFVDEDITESSSAYGENDFHINVSEHDLLDTYKWSSFIRTNRVSESSSSPNRGVDSEGHPSPHREYEAAYYEHIYCEIDDIKPSPQKDVKEYSEEEVENISKELKEVVEIHHEPVLIKEITDSGEPVVEETHRTGPGDTQQGLEEISAQEYEGPRELSIRDESIKDYEGDESIDEILIEMLVDDHAAEEEATDTIVESEEFLECLEGDHLTDVPELPEDEQEVYTPDNWQETVEEIEAQIEPEVPIRPKREHKRSKALRQTTESPRPLTPLQNALKPGTPVQNLSRPTTPRQKPPRPSISPKEPSPRPETPRQVSSRPGTPKFASRPDTPKERSSRPGTPKVSSRPETPKERSPRPESPKERSPRPETPKERSPRPETPKLGFTSDSPKQISRPQTPKQGSRPQTPQQAHSRPETPSTPPGTPKQKPPRPPPPKFLTKPDIVDTKSSRESITEHPTVRVVDEIPKKPPRSLKRKSAERQELVIQPETNPISDLYATPPYAKVKKSGSLTRSSCYQPLESICFEDSDEVPPPVPVQIEELLKPVVPPRTHRPKSMSFGEQGMREEADFERPSVPHRGLKKTSIPSDVEVLNDNGRVIVEEIPGSTPSQTPPCVLKKTSKMLHRIPPEVPPRPSYSDCNANRNVVEPSVSVVCRVDNCNAYVCKSNGYKNESVCNYRNACENGNPASQFLPSLEVGELRVGDLRAHKLKIDEIEAASFQSSNHCCRCGKENEPPRYLQCSADVQKVNCGHCEHKCLCSTHASLSRRSSAFLDPGDRQCRPSTLENLEIPRNTEERTKEIKQILETLLVSPPGDRSRDPSFPSGSLYSSKRSRPKSKSLPRDSHLYLEFKEACKKKRDRRTLWYDDDSGGTYGDIDSSDANRSWKGSIDSNITSNSSGSSDDLSPFQKLFQFLGSFGRGEKKRYRAAKYKERKLSSSFYCDSSYNSSTLGDPREREEEEEMGISVSRDVRGLRGPHYAEEILGRHGSHKYANVLTELSEKIVKASYMAERASRRPSRPNVGNTLVVPAACESSGSSDFHSQEIETSDLDDHDVSDMQSQEEKRQKKAFFVARELMSSEEVFVDVLKLLNVDFREFVSQANGDSKTPVVPDAEFNKILSYLPQLYNLNQELLTDFKDRINHWQEQRKISDVIVQKGPFLKLFSSYIKEFAQQCQLLEDCCTRYPNFAKVCKDFETSERCSKLALKHYMLKPVQRITQYRMLLEDYLKKQGEDSPDYENTEQALNIMREVADHANNIMKQGDEFNKLWSLQSRLPNVEVVLPHRFLVKEGELQKLSRRVPQSRYFILFNDRLLCTSYTSTSLKVDYDIPLTGMRLSLPTSQDYQNELSVISQVKSFTVAARSKEERDEWLQALSEAIEHNTERRSTFHNQMMKACDGTDGVPESLGRQAPVWVPDSRVSMCQLCTTEFTVTFRRHHCRACGKVVCNNCSDNRAPLLYLKCKSVRVCDECYDVLYKEFVDGFSDTVFEKYDKLEEIRSRFKRLNPTSPAMQRKQRKFIPQRLREVCANDSCSQMSGYLHQRVKKSWRRSWFVLKDKVMYVYRASEDVVAMESVPLLGYIVQPKAEQHFQLYEGIDAELVFQLEHPGQQPLIFYAETPELAGSWIEKIKAETVLES